MCANVCATELRNDFFHKRGVSIALQPILHSLPKKQLSLNTIAHMCVWLPHSVYPHMCIVLYVTIPVVILTNECALVLCMCYLLVRRKETYVFGHIFHMKRHFLLQSCRFKRVLKICETKNFRHLLPVLLPFSSSFTKPMLGKCL